MGLLFVFAEVSDIDRLVKIARVVKTHTNSRRKDGMLKVCQASI